MCVMPLKKSVGQTKSLIGFLDHFSYTGNLFYSSETSQARDKSSSTIDSGM